MENLFNDVGACASLGLISLVMIVSVSLIVNHLIKRHLIWKVGKLINTWLFWEILTMIGVKIFDVCSSFALL